MDRARWADLVDSDDGSPILDSLNQLAGDDSYLEPPDPDVESSRKGLRVLLDAAALESGPKDFAFLMREVCSKSNGHDYDGDSPDLDEETSQASSRDFISMIDTSSRLLPVEESYASDGSNSSSCVTIGNHLHQRSASQKRAQPSIASDPSPAGKRSKSVECETICPNTPSSKDTSDLPDKAFSDASSITSTAERSAFPHASHPPATEEDWEHRAEKRRKAVVIVKATTEYSAYAAARPPDERSAGEPQTPDAADRTMSKRRWEVEVQNWRVALRAWYDEYRSSKGLRCFDGFRRSPGAASHTSSTRSPTDSSS